MALPEPSRLPVMPDRSTTTPDPVTPMTGDGPIQAWIRPSSPLRKRWQRTPPVARPLGGYSANGVTLTEAPPVPGSAPDRPDTVTTTAAAVSGLAAQAPPVAGSSPFSSAFTSATAAI